MAIRGEPTDVQRAIAFFKQARCDFRMARSRLRDPSPDASSRSVVVALFQQAVEKALKSSIYADAAAKGLDKKELRLGHTVWRNTVDGNEDFRGLRNAVLGAIEPYVGEDLERLEALAPEFGEDQPNTEYPWRDERAGFCVPAEYFSDDARTQEIEIYERLAGTVIQEVVARDKRLALVDEPRPQGHR